MSDDARAQYTLTRQQVASRLGISTSSVRRMEHDQLHPTTDERGVWLFDPEEVARLAPRTPLPERARSDERSRATVARGRLAARVFYMFARRMTLPQIVVATKRPPEEIRSLYHEWMTGLDEGEWSRRDR